MHARLSALAVAGAALSLALPAVASAGTLTANQSCYTHFPLTTSAVKTQPMYVTVTGGTPGGRFQVRAGRTPGDAGFGSAGASFNASGVGVAVISDVYPSSIDPLAGLTLYLAAHDFTTDTDIATGTTKLTNAAIEVDRLPTNSFRKRVLRVSGLTPIFGAGALYGSYVRGYNGKKVIKRVKLGTPNACGFLKVKRVLPPARGFHKWALYVHVGRHLDRAKSLKYPFRVYRPF